MAGRKLQRVVASTEQVLLRISVLLVLLLCIYLVGKRAIGDWYSRDESPESIQAAINWDRENAQYYDALGNLTSFYLISAKYDESVAPFERATRLSPNGAHYWSDLGAAYDRAGRTNEALKAYQKALQLFPKSPEINWRFANFALRTRRNSESLQALRFVLAGYNPSHREVFRLAERASPDKAAILGILPMQTSAYLDFVNFEMEAGDVSTAEATWHRLLELRLPFELREAFPYLDALVLRHETGRLVAAWSALTERFPGEIGPLEEQPNLVENSGFEHELLDGGLDWRVVPVEGVEVSVDSVGAFEGARALRIEFLGKSNLDYGHVFQYVPVQANTRYRFSGAMRVKGITTDSGIRFQVYDAFDMRKVLVSTENAVGTSGWSLEELAFKTGPDTRLLVVRIARAPSQKLDNQISGTVWVDRIRLIPDG
jgi:hypothetical protein